MARDPQTVDVEELFQEWLRLVEEELRILKAQGPGQEWDEAFEKARAAFQRYSNAAALVRDHLLA